MKKKSFFEKNNRYIWSIDKKNIIYLLLLVLGFFFLVCVPSVWAGKDVPIVVDVYKSSQISSDIIKKKFGNLFQRIANILQSPQSITSDKNAEEVGKLMLAISNGIEKMGDFSYVKINPILYNKNRTVYFSIDLVDKKDQSRLSYFLNKPTRTIEDPDHLIQFWQEYEKKGFDLFLTQKERVPYKHCPAYHCVFGFEHPALKKYQKIFDEGAEKDKKQLVSILRKDKDENKRAAAAFVLAHIKNGEELIKILTRSIYDPSSAVRNNSMRVLAEALKKVKDANFPIHKIVVALDFPDETDRNKAFYIISSLIAQPRYAHYIIRHADRQLMDGLKSYQPNLHDFSYGILREISGKKYNERDYLSWEKWINENKTNSSKKS